MIDIDKNIEEMQDLFELIQASPELMLIIGMAVVVGLVIVLIVTVLSSSINGLKRTLFNERLFSEEKVLEITKLTREVRVSDKRIKEDEIELKKYEEMKKELKARKDEIKALKTAKGKVENERDIAKKSFSDVFDKYNKSLTEIKGVKKRNEELIDERKKR